MSDLKKAWLRFAWAIRRYHPFVRFARRAFERLSAMLAAREEAEDA
jgi:hypothetical protein